MKKKLIIRLSTLVVTFLVASLVYGCSGTKKVIVDRSYADVSFSKLKGDAPLIVAGRITDDGYSKKVDLEKKIGEEEWLVFTYKTFQIDRVYKGNEVKTGDKIVVRVMGGKDGQYEQDEEFSLKKGKRYILFLTPADDLPQERSDAWVVMTGPFGVFTFGDNGSLINPKYKDIASESVFITKMQEKK